MGPSAPPVCPPRVDATAALAAPRRGKSPPPKATPPAVDMIPAPNVERSTATSESSPARRPIRRGIPGGSSSIPRDFSRLSSSRRAASVFLRSAGAPPSLLPLRALLRARAGYVNPTRNRATDLGRRIGIGAEASDLTPTPTPTSLRQIDESIRLEAEEAVGCQRRRRGGGFARGGEARFKRWAPGPRPARTSCSAHRRAP